MSLSPPSNGQYNLNMAKPTAAVMVLDHVPDREEVAELATLHLEEYPADEASASCEIVYTPPDWLEVYEQDQMAAYLRDGAACILVIYMREGSIEDDE